MSYQTAQQLAVTVSFAIEKGWVKLPDEAKQQMELSKIRAEHVRRSLMMRNRLRAEKLGLDTSGFPPRERKIYNMKRRSIKRSK